jgi:SAM-dependent methyltransferase
LGASSTRSWTGWTRSEPDESDSGARALAHAVHAYFREMDARADALTDQRYWDEYWATISLPREVKRAPGTLYVNEILGVFDRFLPRDDRLTAIEVGGAPGQYLAYMHRRFGYHVACLDYSARGCEATRQNLRLLGIPATVIEADLFADVTLPRFDVVYSLGLIEHFADPTLAVERHVRLLKEGGLLVLGVPNFQGVNAWFLARLAPRLLADHEQKAMDLRNWVAFEARCDLEVLFKGYVGGFEPSILRRREEGSWRTVVPYFTTRVLTRLLSRHFRPLRRLNGRLWSGYAMAVYRLRSSGA